MAQNVALIIFQYKPINLQYSWLSVEQPIRIDWVLYKHHWEFLINKKIIPMLTCTKALMLWNIHVPVPVQWWVNSLLWVPIPYPLLSSRPPICIRVSQFLCTLGKRENVSGFSWENDSKSKKSQCYSYRYTCLWSSTLVTRMVRLVLTV